MTKKEEKNRERERERERERQRQNGGEIFRWSVTNETK